MSEKKYHSPSTGEECTAAQYLAEFIVTKVARLRRQILPVKFWNIPKYKKHYVSQIIAANALLNTYPELAVMAAIHSKAADSVFSLRSPILDDLIQREIENMNKTQALIDSSKPLETTSTTAQPRKIYGQPSKLNKLRELDE